MTLSTLFVMGSGPAWAEFCAINVTTDPPGAEVYFNGKLRGLSPLSYMHGHPFTLRVKLVKKGYKIWDREVNIGLNQVVGHHVVLEPLKNAGRKPSRGNERAAGSP